MSMRNLLVTAAVFAVALQFMIVAGTDYTVGAPGGLWDLQTNYTKWVSTITFTPGDNLLFNYTSSHDVWEVKKSDYDTCTGTAINKYTSGNDVIALTEAGTRYFYCSVSGHCARGMKVAVTVVDSNSPPNSPPGSPPSPATVATPPPAPKGNAAAVTAVGSRFAVGLVLGALLMTFV